LPTLDTNSCNSSKKSKLESKAISSLVAYGSDSSDEENEDKVDKKSTILQRLQQKAEMFKQKELDKLSIDKSPSTEEANGQPDILDIICKEVPPDYIVEKPNMLKSSEKQVSNDIFDILKSEVPPDYLDDTINGNIDEENKLVVPSDSKITVNLESTIVETDSKYYSNTDEKKKKVTLDYSKDNSSKLVNLIANYGEDYDDSSNNSFCLHTII